MTVRLATFTDEAQLVNLIHAAHADNGLFDVDDHCVSLMLHRAFDRQGGLIGVIDGNGEIAAAIYMLISNIWYSSQFHLEELFNFVRPQYRKSNYARQLLDFAKKCQAEIGIPLLIGVLTNRRTESKVTLYRKKFGTPAGAFFVVGAHWANQEVEPSCNLWVRHSHGRDTKRIVNIDSVTMTTLPALPLGG